MYKLRDSRGDTIVEVLIALAVLTTVLVGAYVTANRSQNTNRASQERSEAIKTAETQIERLKGLLVSGQLKVADIPAGPFCVNTNNNGVVTITTANPLTEAATMPFKPDDCGINNGRYNVAVSYDTSSKTYQFFVRWNRIGGGRDQINMFYRMYP